MSIELAKKIAWTVLLKKGNDFNQTRQQVKGFYARGRPICDKEMLDEVKALPTYNEFDALIVDNHLDNGDTGFDVIHHIHNTHPLPTIIISADRSQALKDSAQNENIPLLYKPVKAIKLRALLKKILSR